MRMIRFCLPLLISLASLASVAQARPHTVAEQYLMQSVNAERMAAGLPPLAWNPQLVQAAYRHAQYMSAEGSISHQFPGEADLTARAAATGARFSRVAENVGVSDSIMRMHTAFMNSPHHRENILDPHVNSIAIAVVSAGGHMWTVEDFARELRPMGFGQQEQQVASLVARAGMPRVVPSQNARVMCRMDTGFVGPRPGFVMRYTAADLDRLPQQLTSRIASGRYSEAAVGACQSAQRSNFSSYSIAVVLYR